MKYFQGAVFLGMLTMMSLAAMAAEPSTELVAQTSGWILLIQLVLFVHLLLAGRLNSCYRASYSILYVMVLLVSWILAFAILDLSSSLVLGALPLTLPVVYWSYTVSMRLQAHAGGEQGHLSCSRDNGCRF